MVNKSTQRAADQLDSSTEGRSIDDQRRELELELIKIRAEAEAARLEARAAELELTIRRLGRSGELDSGLIGRSERHDPPEIPKQPAHAVAAPREDSQSHQTVSTESNSVQHSVSPAQASVTPAFTSWDAVRSATSLPPTVTTDSTPLIVEGETDSNRPPTENPADTSPQQRIDSANSAVPRPHHLDIDTSPAESSLQTTIDESQQEPELPAAKPAFWLNVDDTDVDQEAESNSQEKAIPSTSFLFAPPNQARAATPVDADELSLDADAEAEEQERRRSPTALLVSTVVHLVILVMLAALTLNHRKPKDQIAMSASVSNPTEASMETFEIESSEPETDPTPSETEYELSPMGEMKVTEFTPNAPPAPPAPAAAAMLSNSQMSAASMALKSDSDAKIQFCGVEGGGNHFVYLVDSSRSMREGFESARAELLHSIDVLKADQRFYVVFFDEEPDYMRLSDPNADESRSVYATAENKQAVRRWAMRITKNDGRAPYDPLKFAIELKPDVIFLLSDGEFPQGIEDLLKEQNRVENLFGDAGPISIVHTIGYHSRAGESRMRRIAQQNDGQYRHVPKP